MQAVSGPRIASGSAQQIVLRDDGKRYTYSGISCMFRRYVKKCGLKDFGALRPRQYMAPEVARLLQAAESVLNTERHGTIPLTIIRRKVA
jgi:hypothetical protein